ncbi:butyrophilin subfamily 3 member A3-like isoform X3 [Artibeus jamaicensis]|uniref:butyrophilin subfamily 3 member A3-like isoform X3 n=1 Tax=Artibeus jamaicensis TaxID=9417 RepID=UPI00235A7CEC|nr:butyrophilin subfamily 3 member A3-like isoform X3 [Artibeus jamaicensis]
MCDTVPCFMSDVYVGSKVVIATHFLLASLSAQQVTMVLPLPALPVCLALVQLLSPCSAAQFAVVGPREPILAMVGEDAELPCHLSPNMSAEHMELMWVRSSPRQVVHTYAHGQEDTPAAEYGGRTSILREDITAGKAALQIRDVRASDRGTYLCYFQDGDFFENAQVQLEVAGSFFQSVQHCELAFWVTLAIPFLLLVGAGCCLWQQHKKVQVLSKEKERERAEKEAAQVQKEAAEAEKAAAQAEKEAAQWEKEAAQAEKEAAQAEKEAAQAEKEAAQAEKEAAQAEKEAAQWEKEAAQAKKQLERSMKEKLQDELRWRMIPYLPREDRSQAYADLKMAFFQPGNVFLDPDTAHPALHVSADQRRLQRADPWQNLPENPERFDQEFCVLGCESFTSGRHFWEVDVGDRAQWCVGVCRENVTKKGKFIMAPDNGFWTVKLNLGRNYCALMGPQMTLTNVSPPARVGVFLDYELGEVSFYNAIDGSHIFTFPHTSFSGPLRPVFGISTLDPTPLTICPAQKAVGRSLVPDRGSDSSLETPVSPGSGEGNGDPQAEETSLLLAAQPGPEGLLTRKISQQEITTNTQSEGLH